MSLANLLTSIQIVLTGFLIYRVQRFLRTHRTWELCCLLLSLAFGIALISGNPAKINYHGWLQNGVFLFLSLIAFEPEGANWLNQIMNRFNPNSLCQKNTTLGEIARAAGALAATKTGALIAFEQNESLLKFGDTGIEINADIKKELLTTLFTKDTPTHDGGVLIRKGQATHCGAVFPLSGRKQIENGLGTRHRAALGLTEKTDAVCLVVSEEEGTISLAKRGELIYAIPPQKLEETMKKLLSQKDRVQYYPMHYIKRYGLKLAEPNFVFFTKSFMEKLYEFAVLTFCFALIFLFGIDHFLVKNDPKELLSAFAMKPWIYFPIALFIINLMILFFHQTLRVNGIIKEVKKESRFFFLPVFVRKWSAANLKAVSLKQEGSARNLMTLGLVTKKGKTIVLDRSTSARTLTDYAKKIRDVLRLELFT